MLNATIDPIVVVGGGVAGLSAAEAARAAAPGTQVVLLSNESSPPYYRLRLIDLFDGLTDPVAFQLHPTGWYADSGIDLRLSTRVVGIDLASKRLRIFDGTFLPYSSLVLAMGSTSFLPPIEGSGLPGVHALWNMEDAISIRDRLPATRRAVVIGGGLLGLEGAYRMSRNGVAVTILEMVPRLLPNQLDPEGSRLFEEQVKSLGIEVRTGVAVNRIEGTDRVRSVSLQDGSALDADLVLFAAGVRPNLAILADTGIAVGRRIIVDSAMRTSQDAVFAAGDVAEVNGYWPGLWSAAKAQGRVAGINAAGGDERVSLESSPYVLSTMETRVASIGEIGSAGPDSSTGEAGIVNEIRRVEGDRFYRKLVFRDGRLVGAVCVGGVPPLQKLNTAIRTGMSREEALKSGILAP
jgi:nitrite reductase (NADH) large subunit